MHIPITPLTIFFSSIMGIISAFLAYKRERNIYLWFTIGFLFGIFGVFGIFFFLSPKKKPADLPPKEPIFSIDGPQDKFWYYLDPSNKQKGPMSHDALTRAFIEGKIGPATYVWHDEMPEWTPLKQTLKTE